MSKQIIVDKRREYKEEITKLRFQENTAERLGFSSEVNRIKRDITWVKEILDLLTDIEKEK